MTGWDFLDLHAPHGRTFRQDVAHGGRTQGITFIADFPLDDLG